MIWSRWTMERRMEGKWGIVTRFLMLRHLHQHRTNVYVRMINVFSAKNDGKDHVERRFSFDILFSNSFLDHLLIRNSKIEFSYHFHRWEILAKIPNSSSTQQTFSRYSLLDQVSYTSPILIDSLHVLEQSPQSMPNPTKLFAMIHPKSHFSSFFQSFAIFSLTLHPINTKWSPGKNIQHNA